VEGLMKLSTTTLASSLKNMLLSPNSTSHPIACNCASISFTFPLPTQTIRRDKSPFFLLEISLHES